MKVIVIPKISYNHDSIVEFKDIKKGMEAYCGMAHAYMDCTKEKVLMVQEELDKLAYKVTIVNK